MAHADWRFVLAKTSDLSTLGDLSEASGKSLDLVLNRAGTARFNIPLTSEIAAEIEPLETCLIAFRGESGGMPTERWSGPILTLDEQLPAGSLGVGCVGWYEELNNGRPLRADKIYSATNNGGGAWRASQVAQDLLATANAQTDTTATVRATKIAWGGFTNVTGRPLAEADPNRQKTWQKGQGIGQAIQEFSDIENGYDMEVKLNFGVTPWKPTLYLYDKKGVVRPDVIFGYNTGVRNLQSVGRSLDASRIRNRIQATGKFGSALVEATDDDAGGLTSIERYGLFEEEINLSEVVDTGILLAYAGAEVAIRSRPIWSYSMTPFAHNSGDVYVPQLFTDYDIGDTVYLSVNYGRFQVTKQAVRIFGASVSIDENGNEQVSSLLTSPA